VATNLFDLPWEINQEPDFVNEVGTKWWKDTQMIKYAQEKDVHGTSLDATCYFVEFADGYRTRLLVSNKNKNIMEDDQTIDGMGSKIDIRKFLLREEER